MISKEALGLITERGGLLKEVVRRAAEVGGRRVNVFGSVEEQRRFCQRRGYGISFAIPVAGEGDRFLRVECRQTRQKR